MCLSKTITGESTLFDHQPRTGESKTMSNIDISGIDKAELLQALFNASKQQGMGFLDASGTAPMTIEDAQEMVNQDAS